MTFKQLVKDLCKREAKRSQVDIAQMSEVVRSLRDSMVANGLAEILNALDEAPKRRNRKK